MGEPPADTRVAAATKGGWPEQWDNYNNQRTWTIIDELLAVSSEIGKEPAPVALNWVKNRPGVTAPIIGARNEKQLASNLGSVGWELPEELRTRLDRVSEIKPTYPHDFIEACQASRR